MNYLYFSFFLIYNSSLITYKKKKEIFQDIAVQMLKEPIRDTFEIEPHIGPNAFATSSITDKLSLVTKA